MPSRNPGEPGIRLAVVGGPVFVVLGAAVMVMMPAFDCRFVGGGLLQGRVRPAQPVERRDGLGEDHEQRQDGLPSPRRSAIEGEASMQRPS